MLYNHSNSSYVYKTIQKMNASLGSQTYINQQNLILSRNNFPNALKSFSKPTLVIAAEQDNITPPKLLNNIEQNISNSIYISINNWVI